MIGSKQALVVLVSVSALGWRVQAADLIDEKVRSLREQLTVAEKIELLCARAPAVKRLELAQYDWWSECLNGVARNGKATVFPKPIALGCMWDVGLMKRVSAAISDEARVKYNMALRERGYSRMYEGLTFFSPTLNLNRDPRWGRAAECFSEDPYLTGRMGVAFVQGLQGDDPLWLKLVATPKHFVANNEEDRRAGGSAAVDEVSLREYYFPAFRAAVTEGRAKSVMGAYNALNGVPCCANPLLLTEVLRNEWGFDGVVISDGSAVEKIFTHHKYAASFEEGAALALKAGCDMALRNEYKEGLQTALQKGLISEEDINKAVERVLRLRLRLGIDVFAKENPYNNLPDDIVEGPAHRQLALEASRKSIVLLKNDGLLPLTLNNLAGKKIGLIGEACKTVYYGDYSGKPEQVTTLWETVSAAVAGKASVSWVTDQFREEIIPGNCLVRADKHAYEGLGGFTGEYFDNKELQGEPVLSRQDMELNVTPGKDAQLKERKELSARWESSLVPPATGSYAFAFNGAAVTDIYINGKLVLSKKNNRKTRETFSLPLQKGEKYGIRVECRNINPADALSLAWKQPFDENGDTPEKIARQSDVVILFLRDDNSAEGRDRKTLTLSAAHVELIGKVTAANPNTVLVLGGGTALLLTDWVGKVPALLNVWISGQGEAQAVSDILFGAVNPSGKTAATFFADEKQLPAMDDYNVKHGRSYQYFKGAVLFPFGYGLSYTTYDYSAPVADSKNLAPDGKLKVTVSVSNKGRYDGEEVVQCYLSSSAWEQDGLKQKLIGFKRVFLKQGESKEVEFTVTKEDLLRWNTEKKNWDVTAADYEVSVVPHSGIKNAVAFHYVK